jgi:hypothetical protein
VFLEATPEAEQESTEVPFCEPEDSSFMGRSHLLLRAKRKANGASVPGLNWSLKVIKRPPKLAIIYAKNADKKWRLI